VLQAVSRLRSPGITGKHIGKATLSMAERKPKSTTLTEAGVSYRIADGGTISEIMYKGEYMKGRESRRSPIARRIPWSKSATLIIEPSTVQKIQYETLEIQQILSI
jgi:hypothetical protein